MRPTMMMLLVVCGAAPLAGCADYYAVNPYVQHSDTVTFSAGDAVAANAAVQTIDPQSAASRRTSIAANGEKAVRAVQRYELGPVAPVNNTSIQVNAPPATVLPPH